MVTATVAEVFSVSKTLFTVPLPGGHSVYMSMPLDDGQKVAVVVDAQKFLRLWRAQPNVMQRDIASGSPLSWASDSKFAHPAGHFAVGSSNPVPLAEAHFEAYQRRSVSRRFLGFSKTEVIEQIDFVTLVDGVTRTIWLLTQGCTAFPVRCYDSCAHALYLAAGATNVPFNSRYENAVPLGLP